MPAILTGVMVGHYGESYYVRDNLCISIYIKYSIRYSNTTGSKQAP